MVTANRGDHREANAGIAAGWLDNRRARAQLPRALGLIDHGDGNAIFDAARRILSFELAKDRRRSLANHAVQANQRTVTNQSQHVIDDPAHLVPPNGRILDKVDHFHKENSMALQTSQEFLDYFSRELCR